MAGGRQLRPRAGRAGRPGHKRLPPHVLFRREGEAPPRLVVTYSPDSTPPTNPTDFTVPSGQAINVWSNNRWVELNWSGASDGYGSGVLGYSYEWSGAEATIPDATVDTTTQRTLTRLEHGWWYFHVRTVDVAGNWNPGASRYGPFKIDIMKPSAPENLTSPSGHTPNAWSANPHVSFTWANATDPGGLLMRSGVRGYAWAWDNAEDTIPSAAQLTTTPFLSFDSAEGLRYLHVKTLDWAGNGTITVHYGPIGIDTNVPAAITDLRAFPAATGGIRLNWTVPADGGSGAARYDVRYSAAPINASNWANAIPAGGAPSPGLPGTVQGMTLPGLTGTRWYFAIKTSDRAGHWSPPSNNDSLLDTGFRPNPRGYSFPNYRDVQAEDIWNRGDFTLNDMVQMYGRNCICWRTFESQCIPYAVMLQQLVNTLQAATIGHCTGFAVTSMRFFKGIDSPAALQGSATAAHDLLKENSRRHLMYFWALQIPRPIRDIRNAAYACPPAESLAALQSWLAGTMSDPVILDIWDGTMGHSITPYALQERPNGIWWVWVYDNNHPDDATRHLEINTVWNTWRYDMDANTTWSGGVGGNAMGVYQISAYAQPAICPWNAPEGLETASVRPAGPASGEIWLTGPGHLLITDAQGRRLGFAGELYVAEIPDAAGAPIPGGMGVALEPIYTVPLAQGITVLLDGSSAAWPEMATIAQLGPGRAATVEGIRPDTITRDRLTFAPDGTAARYEEGIYCDPSMNCPLHRVREVTLTLALDQATAQYRFEMQGADLDLHQAVAVQADLTAAKLTCSHAEAGSGSFNLIITRITAAGAQRFLHREVPIAAGDTAHALFGAWDGIGSLALQVDHGSDGTIDATIVLENQVVKLYLPLVSHR